VGKASGGDGGAEVLDGCGVAEEVVEGGGNGNLIAHWLENFLSWVALGLGYCCLVR
jgi:hypothetical protein